MMDLCNAQEVKALLARHGFRFSKAKGQNFLVASWVPSRIAEEAGVDGDCGVLEIGPGIGPLTQQLCLRAGRVTAVEVDRRLEPVLAETLGGFSNLRILWQDILQVDIPALVRREFSGLRPMACANLPYNITTPVLTALIQAGCFASITVMIQREVALRICAAPGTADYGAFSVFCQYHTAPELLFEVPPECFLPAPKVTSAVIKLVPRQEPPQELVEEGLFFQVVRASFAQRRKTLLNGLTSAFGSRVPKDELRAVLAEAGLPENVRGETLGIPQFAALAATLSRRL